MCCEQIERKLGCYLDGELSSAERQTVEDHLGFCSSCRAGLEELRELVRGIAKPGAVRLPEALWPGIERRLDEAVRKSPAVADVHRRRLRTAPWAIAASILLAIGLGLFGLSTLDTTAQASTVDFRMLLDALPLDAQKAFRRFLVRYDARLTTPIAAKRNAPELNFDTPAMLPGGFRLQAVYELRIGGRKGIAAAYDREGEFLAAVFHPPMKHEKFGSHENYPCVIGEHCGHRIQVGEWKLVHLTDPTTCHCLLSRLDEQAEMPAVMKAIAPDAPSGRGGHDH